MYYNDEPFHDQHTLDLIEVLRDHLHNDQEPPIDLIAVLDSRGLNVNAISTDIMRGN